jgi:RimJ/RimL family protein N-acetyltransferase
MATVSGAITESVARERFQECVKRWVRVGFDAWLWFEKESNQLIGRGGLHEREIDGVNNLAVGYMLFPEFWNKGYATEIATACVDVAFEVLVVDQVYCSAETTNKASLRVIEKAGFEFLKNISYMGESHNLYRVER